MRKYPAKLLLFGEHVLLLGASALAVPVPAYYGYWDSQVVDTDLELRRTLLKFAQSDHVQQLEGFDGRQFQADLENGLCFSSNIPIGYGLGSSGALCAAVYDRYARHKTEDLSALKGIFAQMESFFHGASSGIDALTCYLGQPLLVENKTTVYIADAANWHNAPVVFLIDSGLPRRTGPMVQWFLDNSRQSTFSQELSRNYLPDHEKMLRSWLDADEAEFWPTLQHISTFQLLNFKPMVPATLLEIWKENIENEEVAFKLCGAGGGGFLLGFSRNKSAAIKIAGHLSLVFPFEP